MWLIFRFLIVFLGGFGIARFLSSRQSPTRPAPETLIREPNVPVVAARLEETSIVIHWTQPAQQVVIYAGTNRENIDHSQPIVTASGTNEVVINDLSPNVRYYFELVFDDEVRIIIAERTLPFTSLANFRDIGGYPTDSGKTTRWDRVYRAIAIPKLEEEDTDKLAALNIQLVCDLRSAEEVAEAPDELPQTVHTYLHLPAQAEVSPLERLRWLVFERHRLQDLLKHVYIDVMIEKNPQIFGSIFQRLADQQNLPALIHCTAGKDRTGVTIALLLRLLGVSREIVIADYTLTNYAYAYIQDVTASSIRRLTTMGFSEDNIQPLLVADPETIEAMLDHVTNTYGSVEQYLMQKAGITQDVIDRLRENLLD